MSLTVIWPESVLAVSQYFLADAQQARFSQNYRQFANLAGPMPDSKYVVYLRVVPPLMPAVRS